MTGRRVAAIVALLALVANTGWLVVAAIRHLPVLLGSLALMAVLISAVWLMLSRRG